MNRRLKKIVFSNVILRKDGINFETMASMFKQIPADSKIVSWGDEFCRDAAFFIVESKDFPEVPEAEMIPEQLIVFQKDSPKNPAWSYMVDELPGIHKREGTGMIKDNESNPYPWTNTNLVAATGTLTADMINRAVENVLYPKTSYSAVTEQWKEAYANSMIFGSHMEYSPPDSDINFSTSVGLIDDDDSPAGYNITLKGGLKLDCECGKDTHGFTSHEKWCPKHETI